MATDQSTRRMTLRQLLTHSEKCSRDLVEHVHATLLSRVADFRDLSRPVRRRSHYPKLIAVHNAQRKLKEAGEETQVLAEYLYEQLQDIRERARRERSSRGR
jgi:hypothetical protein